MWLTTILVISVVYVYGLFFFFKNIFRIYSLYIFLLNFVLWLLYTIIFFNKSILWYQCIIQFYNISFFNYSYSIGIDILSISLILLSSFLLALCLISYWNLRYKIYMYIYILIILSILLINIFLVTDFIFFFIFFESIIIPVFLLIGIWGSRVRKISASYQFFIYTLIGSIFILICILDIFLNKGSSSIEFFLFSCFFDNRSFIIFLLLFIGFSIKVPIFPFHIWLPEAHVEASSTGSVILAGILLKLGIYAMYRFLVVPFYTIYIDLIYFILVISVIGLTYSALVALNQIDIKKIIAYSSISHMNFSLIGLFSCNLEGLIGSYIMMLAHGLTSSSLFLSIGILYERYKTRIIFYYGGLVNIMPLFSIYFFIFILSNFSFPGTFNFIGEILILLGGIKVSNMIILFSLLGLLLSLVYSLFLYNKIFYGLIQVFFFKYYSDCTRLENNILFIFFFLIILFGIYPYSIIDVSYLFTNKLYIVSF